MALAKKIEVLLTAGTRQFESAFQKGGKTLDRFRGKSDKTRTSLLKWAGTAVGIYAVVRAITSAGRAAENFNKAMARSVAIMGDVSSQMRGAMGRRAFAATYGTSFNEAETAKAYYYLASAGMDARQSVAALDQVVAFAQAGMFDLSRATDLATDAQSAMGMKARDAQANLTGLARTTDVLIAANTLGNATTEQFSEALTNKAGAAARILGKDIEEVTAALIAFADQGVKGADAGTRLSIAMRDLQTKALLNAAAFKKNRVAVYDAQGEMRNLADIIEDLEKRLAGESDAVKKATLLQMGFSDKSVAALQALIGYSAAMREHEATLRKASGMTQEVAGKSLPAFTEAMSKVWTILKAVIVIPVAGFLEAIGQAINVILWPLEKAAALIREFVGTATDVADWNKGMKTLGLEAEEAAKGVDKLSVSTKRAGESFRDAWKQMERFVKHRDIAFANRGADEMIETYRRIEKEIADVGREQRYAVLGLKGWAADMQRLKELQTPGFMVKGLREDMEKAEKWRAKAEQQAKAVERKQELRDLGKELTREFDPVGQAVERIRDIKASLAEGFMSPEIASKAFDSIRKEFAGERKTVEIGRAGFAARGSAAAFSASLPKETIAVGKQQLEVQRRIEMEIRRGNREAPRLKTGRAA